MRFPSLKHIADNTVRVLRNYPMECLTAIAGTIVALLLSERHIADAKEQQLIKLLMTAALALPSFLAITIRCRFTGYTSKRRVLEYGIITILLLTLFFSFSEPVDTRDIIRFFLLNITAHLMVSCAGFIKRGSTHAFWQFNNALFLQIITACIFSGVLFAGLAGAIAAMDVLFVLKMQEEWYLRIFIAIAGIFNTFFFLSGIPNDPDLLENDTEYPKVLKVFTQFVLVPLVIIYLIILLTYEGKILAKWSLPQGWVSNLILAYGVAGMLSILLVYPIRGTAENNWIKIFSKWFYILLLPLVALMFVAIGTRIHAYGFTEERLFVFALAIWLAAVSFCFLFKPHSDIRIIPLSLASLAILLNFSVFPISKTSQKTRLKHLLQKNQLLTGDTITKLKKGQKISFKDRKNISSIVYYLMQHHSKESLQPWFPTDSLKDDRYSAYSNTEIITQSLGIDYVDSYVNEEDSAVQTSWRTFTSDHGDIPIAGFDYLLPLKSYYGKNEIESRFTAVRETDALVIKDSNQVIATILPREFFKQLIKSKGSVSATVIKSKEMHQDVTTDLWMISVYYSQLEGYSDTTDNYNSFNYEGFILLKKK